MNKFEIAILSEFVLLIAYVLTHIVVSRFVQPVHRWQTIKRLFLPFLISAMAAGFILNSHNGEAPQATLGVLSAVIIVWLIHVGYLTVYAVIDRSISLRVLIEIDGGPPNMTFAQIEALYDPESAFQRRLVILEESGFLKHENGRYSLLDKGRRTGRLVRFLKNLYRTGEGG